MTVLDVTNLWASFGTNDILRGLNVSLRQGEVSAVVGSNGSGKSTLIRCIFGLKRPSRGQVHFMDGAPEKADRPAVGFLRQGQCVFGSLTAEENLLICSAALSPKEQTARITQVMRDVPQLRARLNILASRLSGGEQRLLGLAMVLVRRPHCVLLDEPTAGLSDSLAVLMLLLIRDWCRRWEAGALIVEQQVRKVLAVADTVHVLKRGSWLYSGPVSELTESALTQAFV